MPVIKRFVSTMSFIFFIALFSYAGALEEWDRFEKAVRDQRIPKVEAKKEFSALMDSIMRFAKRFPFSTQEHWIFPVQGHSIKDVGKGGFRPHIRYGSSPIKGYDFYDGNLHGGHPAYDIFVRDENMDCLEDRTGILCSVRAPEDMLILSCFTSWERGSGLRGGNYIWGLNILTRRLFYFAHLHSTAVQPGDFCKAGIILGSVGRTGMNAASARSPTHLHLMVLNAGNERLLPIDIWKLLASSKPVAVAQRLYIEARIAGEPWTVSNSVNIKKGEMFELKVDSIPGGFISWYQIIPDCRPYYKNANFPYEKNPYAWTGFAKITYFREELIELRGKWLVTPAFRCASFSSPYFHDTIGSFWVQAVVDMNGSKRSSYGIEDHDSQGLSPKVFRVSIRESDDYVGYVTSFYNVPGLFGSTPYQFNNYIGIDCADVLMAAYAKWKGVLSTKNYNVAMVVKAFEKRASWRIESGVPDRTIRWGSQVRPGDLIAVRYAEGKQYQHIGALYRDANANGVVDADDLVLQAGPFPLCLTPLSMGSFDGEVVIVRLK